MTALPPKKWLALSAILLLFGCAHSRPRNANRDDLMDCPALANDRNHQPVDDLRLLSSLFKHSCFQETIQLGKSLRDQSRDKVFSIVAETGELFTPEGTFTTYTLESYERAYLSFVLASSYYQLGERDDAAVELRQAYSDSIARLYNYGDDDVNWALQAALWENLGYPNEARPLWQKVFESQTLNMTELKRFASRRVQWIDKGQWRGHLLRVQTFGEQPPLDWHFSSDRNADGYFKITPTQPFPEACESAVSVRVPTRVWSDKIGRRHMLDYHPLVNLKSWTRLPFGLISGVTTAATGAGIGIGGCAVASTVGNNRASSELCAMSAKAGWEVASQSGSVVNYVLQPDLRRWEPLPSAFLFTEKEVPQAPETCQLTARDRNEQSIAVDSQILF